MKIRLFIETKYENYTVVNLRKVLVINLDDNFLDRIVTEQGIKDLRELLRVSFADVEYDITNDIVNNVRRIQESKKK